MYLKMLQKGLFKKQQKQEVNWLEKIKNASSKNVCENPSKLPPETDETLTKLKRIPKEKYISPERRQRIIDELQLSQLKIYSNNGLSENHKCFEEHK